MIYLLIPLSFKSSDSYLNFTYSDLQAGFRTSQTY